MMHDLKISKMLVSWRVSCSRNVLRRMSSRKDDSRHFFIVLETIYVWMMCNKLFGLLYVAIYFEKQKVIRGTFQFC